MSWSRTPGPRTDSRGPYREASKRVPRPPRAPTALARQLIFAHRGSPGVRPLRALIFTVVASLFTVVFCRGVPSDIALSLAGAPAQGTVISAELDHQVEIFGANPTRITFRYEVGSRSYEGASSTLRARITKAAVPGATVPLEVLTTSPDVARVKGTTLSTSGFLSMMFLLFPAGGVWLFLSAIRGNRRKIRAYSHGVATTGHIIKRGEDTTTSVNGRHPFEVVWEFQLDHVTYEGRLSHLQRELLEEALPGNEVTVLYDPANPTVNTVWIE